MPQFDFYIMAIGQVQHGAEDGVLTVFGLLTDFLYLPSGLTCQPRWACQLPRRFRPNP
jgi:hypothetical protein